MCGSGVWGELHIKRGSRPRVVLGHPSGSGMPQPHLAVRRVVGKLVEVVGVGRSHRWIPDAQLVPLAVEGALNLNAGVLVAAEGTEVTQGSRSHTGKRHHGHRDGTVR